jgi:hypothetical protein
LVGRRGDFPQELPVGKDYISTITLHLPPHTTKEQKPKTAKAKP